MADTPKNQKDTAAKKHPNPSKLHPVSGGNDGGEFDPAAAGGDSEFEPAAGGSEDEESEDLLM